MGDDYANWLRENGVDPDGETAQEEVKRKLPWWVWAMIATAGYKGIKFLIAVAIAPQ